MKRITVAWGLAVLVAGWTGAALAASGADKCEAAKNKVAGKYYFCREKAEAKGILKGLAPDYSKCTAKFDEKWDKAEAKGAGACPDTVLTVPMNAYITGQAAETAAVIAGAPLPACGDNAINVAGEQCDGTDLGGETCLTLGFAGGSLACASCLFDTSGCAGAAAGAFPASGQTTAYGPGSDGDVQAGATLSYTDNGDGTITDNNTGLMWEKKDDSGGIHDWDDYYTWSGASYGSTNIMDGTIKSAFVDVLNDVAGGGASCFAGYCDWRIPNVKELQSIVDYEVAYPGPTVSAAFNTSCAPGCTVDGVGGPACSCTQSFYYWSSTTYPGYPTSAWFVHFYVGYVITDGKSYFYYVRAVRGGS